MRRCAALGLETEKAEQRGIEAGTADEGAAALLALQHAVGNELIDCLPDRADRNGMLGGEFRLRRDQIAGTQFPAVDPDSEVVPQPLVAWQALVEHAHMII